MSTGTLAGGARWAAAVLALSFAACPDRVVLTPEERMTRAQNLVVRGVAHAEIDQFSEAIDRFTEALELVAEDPVVLFNLGVAHFRASQPEKARQWLSRVDPTSSPELLARTEYALAKLALEAGDPEREAAAYRRAMELDPSEPAYPYALAQMLPRLGGRETEAEIGALLERAVELWPGNIRLRAELAQWALGRPDAASRSRGLELVAALSRDEPDVEALVQRGQAELLEDSERAPISLRRALNLLRPGKDFQTASAALDARLDLRPIAQLALETLRRQPPADAVALVLEVTELPLETPFEPGETVVSVVAANDAADGQTSASREADLAVLTDRAVWYLARGVERFERLGALAGGRDLVVGELDGDGMMEIVIVAEDGVTVFSRSAADRWTPYALERPTPPSQRLQSGLLLDFEHDGDLDLLLLDEAGRLLIATHRGESGLGAPQQAFLGTARGPSSMPPVGAALTSDLDGDVDQDLLLASARAVHVLANRRQGEYAMASELATPAPLDRCLSADYDRDGRFDLIAASGDSLLFWRNLETRGLTRDEQLELSAGEQLGGVPSSMTVADLDLDGTLELVVGYESSDGGGLVVFSIRSEDRLVELARLDSLPLVPAGLLALDLDGDFDPDLVTWDAHDMVWVRTSGGESQGHLDIGVRGLAGKVPLDGRGVRLEVSFGFDRRAFELQRPRTIVGLGGREPALVKVTWPNGISEYLFDPAPSTAHIVEQELRIEGSCPFLYASNGDEMLFVTDILGLAPLGMLAGPGRYVSPDPEEYLRLPDWVSGDEVVELRISEELREVAYLDQAELVVVDAPAGVTVYNGERWIQGQVQGLDLRLLGQLTAPTSVRDDSGRDVLDLVVALDHRYLSHSTGDRLYQGAVAPGSIEIGIPPELAATDRAALVLTGWLHWGNTSTNVARAQDPRGAPVFPFLEVPDEKGAWRRVDRDVGLPAGKTKPIVVDLSGVLASADPRVRITTDFEVHWDRIAAAVALQPEATSHRVSRSAPRRAELSYGGFSRWYRPADNGPYLFDYSDRRPYPWRPVATGERRLSWLEHEGFYTAFGEVTDLLSRADDQLVIFGSGEELALEFDIEALPPVPAGWHRTLFFHAEGWEKDGDPNVACSQTVGPLPHRAMTDYPCAGTGAAQADGDAGLDLGPRQDRWVDRSRLERRIEAAR